MRRVKNIKISKSFPHNESERPGRDYHFSEQIRQRLLREWRESGHLWDPESDLDLLLFLEGDL